MFAELHLMSEKFVKEQRTSPNPVPGIKTSDRTRVILEVVKKKGEGKSTKKHEGDGKRARYFGLFAKEGYGRGFRTPTIQDSKT